MSEDKGRVSEADLHAYVDDQLDPGRRADVEAYLGENPEAARRAAAYRAQNERLHELFDGEMEKPLPEPVRIVLEGKRRSALGRRLVRIAASLVLVAVGAASGWYARDAMPGAEDPIARFTNEASAAHRLYVSEILHPVEVAAGQEKQLISWLSKRLGHRVTAPALGALGFHLVGGRLLPANDKAAAQFMYEDRSGRRLTLYVRSRGRMEETSFRFARWGRISMFYWIGDSLAYGLIGEIERDKLLAAARAVYEQTLP